MALRGRLHSVWPLCKRLTSTGAEARYKLAHPVKGKTPQWKYATKAFEGLVKSGDRIFVHGIAATPTPLLDGLCDFALENDLHDLTLYHLHLEGPARWTEPQFEGRIRSNSLFTGPNLRKHTNQGKADSMSVFLSEIPNLFRRNRVNLDVALIHVSPPDRKGFCSLGTSIDCTRAAIMNAKYIIAMANPNMPRTLGDSIVHSSHLDVIVYSDQQPHERHTAKSTQQEINIGKLIAEKLVDNGATIQMGIGAIPDACLAAMTSHKDLGIHTEMFSDGVLDLVASGTVSNAKKYINPGKIVTSFLYGSRKLYDFVHDNPMVFMGDIAWVNDTSVIRQNPRVTAINSAIEVDLTGQVVADSVGRRVISGFGGQVDFIRGASLCDDGRGKPIIALPSIAPKTGVSKIVPYIQEGAGVVTTRAHVHYVVTDYGIAQLFGMNMRQRAYQLIKIAHPDHRETLERAAFQRLKCMPSPD